MLFRSPLTAEGAPAAGFPRVFGAVRQPGVGTGAVAHLVGRDDEQLEGVDPRHGALRSRATPERAVERPAIVAPSATMMTPDAALHNEHLRGNGRSAPPRGPSTRPTGTPRRPPPPRRPTRTRPAPSRSPARSAVARRRAGRRRRRRPPPAPG